MFGRIRGENVQAATPAPRPAYTGPMMTSFRSIFFLPFSASPPLEEGEGSVELRGSSFHQLRKERFLGAGGGGGGGDDDDTDFSSDSFSFDELEFSRWTSSGRVGGVCNLPPPPMRIPVVIVLGRESRADPDQEMTDGDCDFLWPKVPLFFQMCLMSFSSNSLQRGMMFSRL